MSDGGEKMRCVQRSLLMMVFAVAMGLRGQVAERHMFFTAYPTIPFSSGIAGQDRNDSLRDGIEISMGHYYYNVSDGNNAGDNTKLTKKKWFETSLKWMTNKLDAGIDDMDKWTGRGTAAINGAVTYIRDLQPQLTMPMETVEYFQQGLELYKIYRSMEVMKNSWRGSMFKLDLLDVLPVMEMAETDQFGAKTTSIRVGLTYKDGTASGDIFSKAGMDNPFIGDWDNPKLKYQGPHKLEDIGMNVEVSPFGSSNQETLIKVGRDFNEVMDRNFFEGIMGQWQAKEGLAYHAPEDARPSPKLIKQRGQALAQIRAQQIEQEIAEIKRLYKGNPQRIKEMTDSLFSELQYWLDMPDVWEQSQAKRIERLRNEMAVTNNVTQERESVQAKQNDAMPDTGNGFFDSVFNTYSTIGQLTGELLGNEDDKLGSANSGESGPQLLMKAKVQYAKATHGAFYEAVAIRKMIHARIKAECQERMADGFQTMKRQVLSYEGRVRTLESKVADYSRKLKRLNETMQEAGIEPKDFVAGARAARGN